MKKIYLLFSVNFLFLITNAQTYDIKEYYKNDSNGCRQGKYQQKCNDSLLIDGFYLNNMRDSLWRFYSYDGKLLLKGYYKDGKKDSIWTYYENNSKITQIEFSKGILDGKLCTFFPSGEPYFSYSYKNGQLDGEVHIFRTDGTSKEQSYFRNGLMDSLFVIFDKKGAEKIKIDFKKGHPYSIIKSEKVYDYDIRFKGNLCNGTGQIKTLVKTASGTFCQSEVRNYISGKLNKNYAAYRNCVISTKGKFDNNYAIGKWKYYNSYGLNPEIRNLERTHINDISGILYDGSFIHETDFFKNQDTKIYNYIPDFLAENMIHKIESISPSGETLKLLRSKKSRFDVFVEEKIGKRNIQYKGLVIVKLTIDMIGEVVKVEVIGDMSSEDKEKIYDIFIHLPLFEPLYKDRFPINFKKEYNFILS